MTQHDTGPYGAERSSVALALLPPFASWDKHLKFTYEPAFAVPLSAWRPEDRVEAYFVTTSGKLFAVGYDEQQFILPGGLAQASSRSAKEGLQKLLSEQLGFQLAQANLLFLGRYSIGSSLVYVFGALLQEYSFVRVRLGPYESLNLFSLSDPLPLIDAHKRLVEEFQWQISALEASLKGEEA